MHACNKLMLCAIPYRHTQSSALEQLEHACQGWPTEDRGASKDLNDWQHQLRSLVQAGIPMVRDRHQCASYQLHGR